MSISEIGANPSFCGMLRLIGEDLAAHGGDWTRPGFKALAVHRFGVWRMTISPKLLRAPLSATLPL